MSGLRIESDKLTKELHNTRRAVSVEYRNKEETGLKKLAVQTDMVQKVRVTMISICVFHCTNHSKESKIQKSMCPIF